MSNEKYIHNFFIKFLKIMLKTRVQESLEMLLTDNDHILII